MVLVWAGLCASTAHAQVTETVLAIDGAFTRPMNDRDAAPGGGFGFRAGARIEVPDAWLTFELGLNYAHFQPSSTSFIGDSFNAYRGVIGPRLSLHGFFRPGICAHIGAGRVTGSIGTPGAVTRPQDISHTALTWDVGAFLDLAIVQAFELGVYASYQQIIGTIYPPVAPAFQWSEFGAHVAVVF